MGQLKERGMLVMKEMKMMSERGTSITDHANVDPVALAHTTEMQAHVRVDGQVCPLWTCINYKTIKI